MMKTTLLRSALILGTIAMNSISVGAQSRIDSQQMTCEAAMRVIDREGAVIVTTGPSTYERVVRSQGFCLLGENIRPLIVRSKDREHCSIGFYCATHEGRPRG